ncbi:hypothetical protein AB1Y20_016917 [Prymnesium parvum]|uniref:MBD domain-containing protein n=1 Tax=Prymnesium parvum TaxID=97485 RepID=A0AB34ICH8_PRYPA
MAGEASSKAGGAGRAEEAKSPLCAVEALARLGRALIERNSSLLDLQLKWREAAAAGVPSREVLRHGLLALRVEPTDRELVALSRLFFPTRLAPAASTSGAHALPSRRRPASEGASDFEAMAGQMLAEAQAKRELQEAERKRAEEAKRREEAREAKARAREAEENARREAARLREAAEREAARQLEEAAERRAAERRAAELREAAEREAAKQLEEAERRAAERRAAELREAAERAAEEAAPREAAETAEKEAAQGEAAARWEKRLVEIAAPAANMGRPAKRTRKAEGMGEATGAQATKKLVRAVVEAGGAAELVDGYRAAPLVRRAGKETLPARIVWFSPSGKRFRSVPEVCRHLGLGGASLTKEMKTPQGKGGEEEEGSDTEEVSEVEDECEMEDQSVLIDSSDVSDVSDSSDAVEVSAAAPKERPQAKPIVRVGPSAEQAEADCAEALRQLGEHLKACGGGAELVHGWKVKLQIRANGASAGHKDCYYFAPDGTRYRSKAEVCRVFSLPNLHTRKPLSLMTRQTD